MKKIILPVLLMLLLSAACKKEYSCACGSDTIGKNDTTVFKVRASKSNADKKCTDYYNARLPNVPEWHCAIK